MSYRSSAAERCLLLSIWSMYVDCAMLFSGLVTVLQLMYGTEVLDMGADSATYFFYLTWASKWVFGASSTDDFCTASSCFTITRIG